MLGGGGAICAKPICWEEIPSALTATIVTDPVPEIGLRSDQFPCASAVV